MTMKFSATLATIAASGFALASPAVDPAAPFTIMSLRSASPIHFGQVDATKSSLFVNGKQNDAVCEDDKTTDRATFYVKDSVLHMYTSDDVVQTVFVDLSGMGQGKIGYTTNADYLPPHFQTKGWGIDSTGNLHFNKSDMIACEGEQGYSIWMFNGGSTPPGGNTKCLGFSARTVPVKEPVRCEYSQ